MMMRVERVMRWMAGCAMAALVSSCRPSDVLSVPVPAGVIPANGLQSQSGAESVWNTARAQIFDGLDGAYYVGVLQWSEVVTDEFTWVDFSNFAVAANVDARHTAPLGGFYAGTDPGWTNLLLGRSSMLAALPLLQRYEPASGRAKIGESYALLGYAELLLAEDYCAGTVLDQLVASTGTVAYGMPLTTDSLLGVAEAHFDSALANAHGDATVVPLARVGLGRTLVDRGRWDSAAVAVASVPTGFVYNADLPPTVGQGGTSVAPNVYAYQYFYTYPLIGVADREGGNGLNFITAHDPRVVIDSTLAQTYDGGTWYFPAKFEGPGQEYIALASGVEAQLIQAEAALQSGQVPQWASELNALRADAADTKVTLAPLTADSTTTASAALRVDVMFRERAFWLFGTGTRLGDLRRLIRQYGRDQSVVFPSGVYPNGHNAHLPTPLPTYGTDVNLTLPTQASGSTITNPNYKGCIDRAA